MTRLTYTDPGAPPWSPEIVKTYEYSDRRILRGSEPGLSEDLGFRSVMEKDAASGARTTNLFLQTLPFQGLAEKTALSGADGKLYSETLYEYGARNIEEGIDFVYPSAKTTKAWDGAASSYDRREEYEYDEYGNPTLLRDLGDASEYDDAEMETEWAVNEAAWVMAPSRQTARRMARGAASLSVERETRYYYDGSAVLGVLDKGLLTREEAENGLEDPTAEYEYDGYGNLAAAYDPNAVAAGSAVPTLSLTYDDMYHAYPVTGENALGMVRRTNYDSLMRPVEVLDENGQSWKTAYDAFGRTVASASPGDALEEPTTRVAYDDAASPRLVTVERKEGGGSYLATKTWLDGLGRPIEAKRESASGAWITRDTYYDGSGRVWRVSVPYEAPSVDFGRDAGAKYSETEYDAVGRPRKTTAPDGTYIETVYDRQTVYAMDAARRVRSQAVAGNAAFATQYSGAAAAGATASDLGGMTAYRTIVGESWKGLSVLRDAAGNEAVTEYDGLGRKVSYTDTSMGAWSFAYDPNGNLAQRTDARGVAISYQYDELNRPILKDYPGGADTVYSYDETGHGFSAGRLTRVNYGEGSDSYTYDERGRVSTRSRSLGGGVRTMSWTYDSLDRVASATYPDGETVVNAYGADGELESLSGNPGGSAYVYAAGILYDPWNRMTALTAGNGVTTLWDYYDEASEIDPSSGLAYTYRLKRISAAGPGTALDFTYGYDASGNVISKTDGVNPAWSQTFGYDDYHRLTYCASGSSTSTYAYDALDRFTAKDGRAYSYDAASPYRITNDGTRAYTYDAAGNMTGRSDGRVLAWDDEGRLQSVSDGGSYAYGSAYERVRKTENGTTTYYYFPGYEEEWTGDTRSDAVKYYFANALRIAQRSAARGLAFIHTDHLGSSSALTDEAGASVRAMSYAPYGEMEGSVGSEEITKTFTGYTSDSGGLLYANARYYDPELGRFLSADPGIILDVELGLEERLNAYLYCGNNPVRYTDPTGLYEAIDTEGVIGWFGDHAVNTDTGQTVNPNTGRPDTSNTGEGPGREYFPDPNGNPYLSWSYPPVTTPVKDTSTHQDSQDAASPFLGVLSDPLAEWVYTGGSQGTSPGANFEGIVEAAEAIGTPLYLASEVAEGPGGFLLNKGSRITNWIVFLNRFMVYFQERTPKAAYDLTASTIGFFGFKGWVISTTMYGIPEAARLLTEFSYELEKDYKAWLWESLMR